MGWVSRKLFKALKCETCINSVFNRKDMVFAAHAGCPNVRCNKN